MEDSVALELMANRFSRLVKELLDGVVRRTSFQPWEVHLLLDLEACRMPRSRRDEALRRYERAVRRQLEKRQVPPIRFSDFVGQRARKMAAVPPPSLAGQDAPSLNP